MKLANYLGKLGNTSLLSFLNKRTEELLKHLNYLEKITPIKLAKIVIKSIGENQFILKKKYREELINTINKKEATELTRKLTQKNIIEPYKFLKNLPFKKNSKEFKIFQNFFEIQLIKETTIQKETEMYKIKDGHLENEEISTFYPLFKHQIDACADCLNILKSENPRAFLHMPTGSGKTRTAINVMCNLLRENSKEFVVVWLANKEELCDQAFTEFEKAWQILGNQKIKIFKHFGGEKSNLVKINKYCEDNVAVIFSSLDMMYEDVTRNISSVLNLSHKIGFVIMDEAHLTIAKTYKTIIEILASKEKTSILGMSATPGRSYRDVSQDLELKNFYHGNKVSLKIGKSKDIIKWLVQNKYLAKAKIEKINYEADLAKLFTVQELNNEIERINSGKDYSKKFRDKISNDNERLELTLDLIKSESKTNEKIIVFASSMPNAIAIGDILNIEGIKAATITSKTDPIIRRRDLNLFKNTNKINILVNYDVLTTGFDAPKAKIAIIARPTTSIVLYHQMIGRVARGKKQGGNDSCKILTVVDKNLPGYKDLSDSFYFWEDIWNG